MSLRRTAPLVLALAAACAKDVEPEQSPPFVDYSVFDPSASAIPLPNDLALFSAPLLPAGAQKELLLAFAAQGGFPNDIEVPISIDFTRVPVGGGAPSAPTLDLATIRPPGNPSGATLALLRVDPGAVLPAVAAYDPPEAASRGTTTTLTIRAPAAADGSRHWEAGAQYIVAVRGGANGVKTAGGGLIRPMPAMYLLLQGRNLADPANQGLLPDPAAGAQLEAIRQNYVAAFQAVEAVFPSRELANLSTFAIAPSAGTVVRVDETAGVVPLPFDLLRTDADGTVIFNDAFGPAAVGIDTLDGFSTTAMMLAQTSGPIDAATVTGNVFLFELGGTSPVLVKELVSEILGGGNPAEAVYVAQPPAINQTCLIPSGSCSTVIGLQPAVPAPVPGVGTFYLPPLKEDTEYAVVVTDDVKDVAAQGLARSTIAKILLDVVSPVAVGGVSQLAGIDGVTASALESMRQKLAPVYAALPGGRTKADVAMAYTFKTQSITGTALELAALPYAPEAALICANAGAACDKPVPSSTVFFNSAGDAGAAGTVSSLFSRFGVDALAVPQGAPGMILVESEIYVLDLMDPATGAFRDITDPAQAAQVVPKPARILIAAPAGAGAVPLVVFQHGINHSRADMLMLASTLTSAGFVVAAIDLPLHGHRAYCNRARVPGSPNAECVPGDFCVEELPGQGDPTGAGPGLCRVADDPAAALGAFVAAPALCVTPAGCAGFDPTAGGMPAASGEFLVSANFFRTRDALRQAVVDISQLVRVMTPVPASPPGPIAGQDVFNVLLQHGTIVNPLDVHWVSQSLGSIVGTMSLASNPRFERGVLSAGGATIVDVMLNSPDFKPEVDALFSGLGIPRPPVTPADQAATLQLVNVLKWILDPADPINFAGHVTHDTLPNLLAPGGIPGNPDGTMFAKDVIAMNAVCDQVVTNPFQALLDANLGLSPTSPSASATGATVQWYTATTGPAIPDVYPGSGCGAGVRVRHSFLVEWGAGFADAADRAALAQATQLAQDAAAAFLIDGTRPATPVIVP